MYRLNLFRSITGLQTPSLLGRRKRVEYKLESLSTGGTRITPPEFAGKLETGTWLLPLQENLGFLLERSNLEAAGL